MDTTKNSTVTTICFRSSSEASEFESEGVGAGCHWTLIFFRLDRWTATDVGADSFALELLEETPEMDIKPRL